jgi:hypothetical protein
MEPASPTDDERAEIIGGASLLTLLAALVPMLVVGLLFDHFERAIADAERRFNAHGKQ